MSQVHDHVTYLTDAAEPGPGQPPPRVGDVVELRVLRAGQEIEAWTRFGRLGRLPPSECAALDGLLPELAEPWRITAVVPRPRHTGTGRIHIGVAAR